MANQNDDDWTWEHIGKIVARVVARLPKPEPESPQAEPAREITDV